VRVHKSNLIGNLNEGFKYIMYNFNHERWQFACQGLGSCKKIVTLLFEHMRANHISDRVLLDYFHKALLKTVKLQNYVDSLSVQYNNISPEKFMKEFGEVCALVKVLASRTVEELT